MKKRLNAPALLGIALILFSSITGAPLFVRSAHAQTPAATDEQVLAGAGERIARYRMGNLTVRVVDRRGRALTGAAVDVEQTRHAFLFGANIFLLDPLDSSNVQRAYQERFAALFNYATLPFYWGTFEEQRGRPQYARLERMARWSVEHGITPKGHPLIWHEVYPRWAPPEPEATIPLLRERVTDIITRYKGLISVWDVINEANVAPDFKNGLGRWVKRDGAAPVVRTALQWARRAARGSRTNLIYNDYEVGPKNVALLTELAAQQSLPDTIGLQSHMHKEIWPLTRVWEVCETYARFGRPLHFTEVTVISGPQREFSYQGPRLTDWLTTPQDEARQADYVEKFYTLLFSHPAVEAITWWDLSDTGAWLGAPAGLLRRDMTPKPAYERLMSLVHGKWWTRAKATTDERGQYRTRAFLGDYKINVTARGRTRSVVARLTKNEDGETLVTIRL